MSFAERQTESLPRAGAEQVNEVASEEFLDRHLAGVSRTYAVVIPMLPAGLREAVGLAYLLMRVVDTVEDAPQLSDEQRQEHLARLEALVTADPPTERGERELPIGESDAERSLMQSLPELLAGIGQLDAAYRAACRTCSCQMIVGVRRLLDQSAARGAPYPAVRDLAELRTYCYYVAGVVGEMLCDMMAHWCGVPALRRLRALAVELGTGLQLVNILKDAARDAAHGRRYLPPSDPRSAAPQAAVMEEARRCLRQGIEYVLALPRAAVGLRAFSGLPIVWAALTLQRVERQGAGAKITRDEIAGTIAEFQRRAASDDDLQSWLLKLLECESAES